MGLLTAPTVKKFEFHKSKMADWLIFIKFGTMMHVGPQSLA